RGWNTSSPRPAFSRGKDVEVSVSPATTSLTFIALAVLVTGTWSWLVAGAKAALTWGWLPQPVAAHVEALLKSAGLSPRLPLIQWSQRRPVPWGFIDLIILMGAYVIASVAVSAVLRQMSWIDSAADVEQLS